MSSYVSDCSQLYQKCNFSTEQSTVCSPQRLTYTQLSTAPIENDKKQAS